MENSIYLCDKFEDAVVAYIIKAWAQESSKKIGRIVVQKLCYFAKEFGVPLNYEFDVYHYGPYCQDLYHRMDDMIADDIVKDEEEFEIGGRRCRNQTSSYRPSNNIDNLIGKFSDSLEDYKQTLNKIVSEFKNCSPNDLELYSTVKYYRKVAQKYYGKDEPTILSETVRMVKEVKKDKFSKEVIKSAYETLEKVI